MDAKQLYTEKVDAYVAFNAAFRSPQALRAFFDGYRGLQGGMRVLDAGCGTGDACIALLESMRARGLQPSITHAFDLTPAMLQRFRAELDRRSLPAVEVREADVLHLDALPPDWRGYDLVVCVAMLEYVPPAELATALAGLRARLASNGRLLLFITRRNAITWLLISRWWHANRYSRAALVENVTAAGFGSPRFLRYPNAYFWQNTWAHVLEAGPGRIAAGD